MRLENVISNTSALKRLQCDLADPQRELPPGPFCIRPVRTNCKRLSRASDLQAPLGPQKASALLRGAVREPWGAPSG